MGCNDTYIRERLEYLKRFTYEELNRLKIRILSEKNEEETDSGHEDPVVTACKNGEKNKKDTGNTLIMHKKAFKRSGAYSGYRKYKK